MSEDSIVAIVTATVVRGMFGSPVAWMLRHVDGNWRDSQLSESIRVLPIMGCQPYIYPIHSPQGAFSHAR